MVDLTTHVVENPCIQYIQEVLTTHSSKLEFTLNFQSLSVTYMQKTFLRSWKTVQFIYQNIIANDFTSNFRFMKHSGFWIFMVLLKPWFWAWLLSLFTFFSLLLTSSLNKYLCIMQGSLIIFYLTYFPIWLRFECYFLLEKWQADLFYGPQRLKPLYNLLPWVQLKLVTCF